MAEMATADMLKVVYPWYNTTGTECQTWDYCKSRSSLVFRDISGKNGNELVSINELSLKNYFCKSTADKTPISTGGSVLLVSNEFVTTWDIAISNKISNIQLSSIKITEATTGAILNFNITNLTPGNISIAQDENHVVGINFSSDGQNVAVGWSCISGAKAALANANITLGSDPCSFQILMSVS